MREREREMEGEGGGGGGGDEGDKKGRMTGFFGLGEEGVGARFGLVGPMNLFSSFSSNSKKVFFLNNLIKKLDEMFRTQTAKGKLAGKKKLISLIFFLKKV